MSGHNITEVYGDNCKLLLTHSVKGYLYMYLIDIVTHTHTYKMQSCIGPTVDSTTCTIINCNVSNLKPGIFTISVFTRIDERYFSTQVSINSIVYDWLLIVLRNTNYHYLYRLDFKARYLSLRGLAFLLKLE